MKKFRLSFALVVLALILALVPAVLAQDETFGLSTEDFNTWTSANAASVAADSLSYDFTATLDVAGIQGTNVSANLKGSGVLSGGDSPAFQLDVTGTVTQNGTDTPVNVGVRLVGDSIYFNIGDGSGWQGAKLQDAMQAFGQGFVSGSGLPLNPSDIAKGDLSGLTSSPEAMSAMSALSQLKPSDFLSLTRADANGLAQFTLALNIEKLLSSPALTPLIAGGMSSSGSGTVSPPTDAQLQQAKQTQAMLGAMFTTSKITFDQYIDTGSSLVQRAVLDINIPLDNIMGPGAVVKLNFDINLSNYGESVTVEAPADAKMMPSSSGS
jgi:hypothetical protein